MLKATRATLFCGLGGAIGAVASGVVMVPTGLMRDEVGRFVGTHDLGVAFLAHVLIGFLLALPLAIFMRSMRYGRASLIGAAYGLVVGAISSYWSPNVPLDLALHVAWGVIAACIGAYGLRRTAGIVGRVRLMIGRPV